MPALPDSLAALAILRTARSNAAEYFAPLLASANQVLEIGAWTALLERNELSYAQYPQVLALASKNPGIRRRAFRHFMAWCDYEQAEQVLALQPPAEGDPENAAMLAELHADNEAAARWQRALYIATGRPELLAGLVTTMERTAGWRAALPVAVDQVVLNPHEPMAMLQLLGLVQQARQAELVAAIVGLLEETGLHPGAALLYRAVLASLRDDWAGSLKLLQQVAALRAARPDVAMSIRVTATALQAEALEKTGDYRKAYAAYAELNKLDPGKPYDLQELPRTIVSDAALPVPPLPEDPRSEVVVMTGFPRSGTTLLENALAAHPLIETFEEIPSWSSMQLYLDLTLPTLKPEADHVPLYLHMRQRYYAEIDRIRRKPEARVLVDKMPMRSAEAGFFIKLFPEKRYIFSIRHPFDVVLSCFKQQFVRNVAMEHFRSFESAVKLYDFTMTQWFAVHGFDDPHVHYLRYDTLVTDFEPTLRAALEFLDVGWNPAVLDFAKAAEQRAAKTPSYQKVRQGLSIGVQTSWRNYRFLFESEAARPLRKWVAHFGYEAK
jgi:tetratricopeptide (TPR) repeat protein